MLILYDNCCLMPIVHLILTANFDYLQLTLGGDRLMSSTLVYTLVQVAAISTCLLTHYHRTTLRRAQKVTDFNAFLISDQFTSSSALLAIAQIQECSEDRKNGSMYQFQNRLQLKVLKKEHNCFKNLNQNATLSEVCAPFN